MKYFLCVIGMVMFLEGLPYAAFPEKMKKMLRSILTMPSSSLRPLGFVLMAAGLCLVFLGRR
jgi:uncharacterized protein YjeT (DUF2065 family)